MQCRRDLWFLVKGVDKKTRRADERMKKKVYICAPLGGNVKENLENAVLYTKYALKQGVAPITTHFYALCLDDDNPQERALGMSAGMSLLWYCDELWVFGNAISNGMKEEIKFCENLRIPVKRVSNAEVTKFLKGSKSNDENENKSYEKNVLDSNVGGVFAAGGNKHKSTENIGFCGDD